MAQENFILNKLLEGLGPVDLVEGGSGYFSSPDDHLDPRLFNGDKVRPEVRQWLLSTLYEFWEGRYGSPRSWSTVWIAGSGISYQWAAARGNGDLDILIGLDVPAFFNANRDLVGMSQTEVADMINRELREGVWANTDNTLIGTRGAPDGDDVGEFSGTFEVTFYVNPDSADIRQINPYAAYNLTTDQWTVKPPELPENPETNYAPEYWDHVHREREYATKLVDQYNTLSAKVAALTPGTPGWINAMSEMGLTVDQAQALFDEIHIGRKKAFSPSGSGYGDFHNFRWQAHKRYGTVQALNAIGKARRSARDSYQTEVHGAPIATAAQSLMTAALWNSGRR